MKGDIDLHCGQDNAHEFEVTVDLLLMASKLVDSALNAFKGLDVSEVFLFRCPVEQSPPVVHRKALDRKAKLERGIRERRSVLALSACRKPSDSLADMVPKIGFVVSVDVSHEVAWV